MATAFHIATRAALVAATLFAASLALSGQGMTRYAAPESEDEEYEEYNEGRDTVKPRPQEPDALEAAFALESYVPGATARLRIWTAADDATIRIFHIGPERQLTVGDKTLEGVPVTAPRTIAKLRKGAVLTIRIGDWPSGVYFAKLTAPGRTGFAPFVVRPKRLGEHRVAVVEPTHTWQAYNFRDDDGDGHGDTWYATWGHLQARLARPYLNRGVPSHFRSYDLRFLHWLHDTGRQVDVLSQRELDHTTGAELASAYDLIVFPGHHEYVTRNEYDAVKGFRDRGGNLAFLSANNFFWRIDLRGNVMTRVHQWRDEGRPEAALIGVQYAGNDRGEHRGPWLVHRSATSDWLFAGIELINGNEFGNAGIEIDATAPSSPRTTQVVAEVPNLLGPGLTAQMTYYELPNGAKVFAAGAFSLAGAIRNTPVQQLVTNVWTKLTAEGERQ